MDDPTHLRETERWFVQRGLPHFIAEYSATEDVLTRALPGLVVIFLFSAYAAVDLSWPPWGIVLAVIGGFCVLLGAWAALNRARGRRPLALPDRVGAAEMGAFVFVPALLPIVFGGDWSEFFATIAIQIVLLAIVYVATSYGLVAVLVWAAGQGIRSLGATFRLLARGLPLLLLGFMFLFVNAEAWQSAGTLEPALLGAVLLLFAALSAVFVIAQMPREIRDISSFVSWDEVAGLVGDSPLAGLAPDGPEPPSSAPLSRREWGNVGLVVLFNQGLQILLVSLLIGSFFVAFGLLLIRPSVITQWIGSDPSLLWRSFSWFGRDVQLTTELLQVSGFLAGFAGVYFSVYTITDATFRSQFFDDVVREVRESLAVRVAYHELRNRS